MTSCKIALNKASSSLRKWFSFGMPAPFFLEIDKAGGISQLALVGSSGIEIIDLFVLNMVRDAAPFPPIPDYLGLSRYQVTD